MGEELRKREKERKREKKEERDRLRPTFLFSPLFIAFLTVTVGGIDCDTRTLEFVRYSDLKHSAGRSSVPSAHFGPLPCLGSLSLSFPLS